MVAPLQVDNNAMQSKIGKRGASNVNLSTINSGVSGEPIRLENPGGAVPSYTNVPALSSPAASNNVQSPPTSQTSNLEQLRFQAGAPVDMATAAGAGGAIGLAAGLDKNRMNKAKFGPTTFIDESASDPSRRTGATSKNPVSLGAAPKKGILPTVAKAGGGLLLAASEVPELYRTFSDENATRDDKADAVVGAGSRIAGAGIGAKTGAAVGSVVGPVGTVAGGIIGGTGGYFLGDRAADLFTGDDESIMSRPEFANGPEPVEASAPRTDFLEQAQAVSASPMDTSAAPTGEPVTDFLSKMQEFNNFEAAPQQAPQRTIANSQQVPMQAAANPVVDPRRARTLEFLSAQNSLASSNNQPMMLNSSQSNFMDVVNRMFDGN